MRLTRLSLYVRSGLALAVALLGMPQFAAAQSQVFATGGTVTDVGTDRVHTYTAVGASNFNVTTGGNVQYLVVGGGGGGGAGAGSSNNGGGGGAGGVLAGTTALGVANHSVAVGAGGVGGSNPNDPSPVRSANGGNSQLGSITANGGGGGGGGNNGGPFPYAALSGGSGGGGAIIFNTSGAAGTAGQGFAGGNGNPVIAHPFQAGGGGGAGETGNTDGLGFGGDGISNSITGGAVFYGGGGGGGQDPFALPGGDGGGGSGGVGEQPSIVATAGAANTGGGGGGGGSQGPGILGGAGGSGIVIVRYAAPYMYYDTNGATPGLAGGAGNWSTSNFWSFDPNGAATTGALSNTARTAVFNSSGSSTVTVAGTQSAFGLNVNQVTVTFADGGSGVLSLNGGAGVATIASGAKANFNLTLSGSANLTGGTIGGTGVVSGALTGNGILSPGNGVGMLTVQNGISNSGSYLWELGTLSDQSTGTAGVNWDLVQLSGGAAALNGMLVDLDFSLLGANDPNSSNPFWNTNHQWKILDLVGSATLANAFSGINASDVYSRGVFSLSVGSGASANDVFLNFAATPEPASIAGWIVVGASVCSYGFFRVRKNSQRIHRACPGPGPLSFLDECFPLLNRCFMLWRCVSAALFGVLALAALQPVQAQVVFNANTAFIDNETPNGGEVNPFGPWSYGTRATAGPGAFTPITNHADTFAGNNLEGYFFPNAFSVPAVLGNVTAAPVVASFGVTMEPGEMLLHPDATNSAAVRFTAPFSGTYSFVGNFERKNAGGNGTSNSILVNDLAIFVANLVNPSDVENEAPGAFNVVNVTLQAGDRVDFLNSAIAGDFGSDSTGFTAVITGVALPEPASIACWATMGLLGLVWRVRRTRR